MAESVAPPDRPLTLEENDALVFCSDGLHDLVDDWEVAKAIAGKDPNEAAQTLAAHLARATAFERLTAAEPSDDD